MKDDPETLCGRGGASLAGWSVPARWKVLPGQSILRRTADDLESLLYLVNLGTIPLHLWPSRIADIDRPDWCCIDVDAGDRGFGAVMRVALRVKELCDAIDAL